MISLFYGTHMAHFSLSDFTQQTCLGTAIANSLVLKDWADVL